MPRKAWARCGNCESHAYKRKRPASSRFPAMTGARALNCCCCCCTVHARTRARAHLRSAAAPAHICARAHAHTGARAGGGGGGGGGGGAPAERGCSHSDRRSPQANLRQGCPGRAVATCSCSRRSASSPTTDSNSASIACTCADTSPFLAERVDWRGRARRQVPRGHFQRDAATGQHCASLRRRRPNRAAQHQRLSIDRRV